MIVHPFGSWDCSRRAESVRCPTHFFYFRERPSWEAFKEAVQERIPGHAEIQRITVARNPESHSLLHYCRSALSREGYTVPDAEEAKCVYDLFVTSYRVDTTSPIYSGYARDDRDIVLFRDRRKRIWTMDSEKVCRPRERGADTLMHVFAIPAKKEYRQLFTDAEKAGLCIEDL